MDHAQWIFTPERRAIYTRTAEKLRLFILVFARNIFLQTLLNQYIDGTPQGQHETSPKRNEAGPG